VSLDIPCLSVLLAAILSGEPASELVPFESAPIRVTAEGPTSLTLSAPDGDRNYLLITGSTAMAGSTSSVEIKRTAINPKQGITPLDIDATTPPEWWTWRVKKDREQMQRARKPQSENDSYVVGRFAPIRNFHLFVGEDNLYDTRKYVDVRAALASVGKYCVVYADSSSKVEQALIDDVVKTFDERVYPSMQAVFGNHRDVDRNGKFTILLTDWLNRLSDGKVALSGFVRGADFYRDVEPPFSNRCDMLYMNASLEPGPHMRTVLAHEYTHAITFSEHTFGEYLSGGQGRDEEAWLGEAVAHLAENLSGEGWSNLDYRVSTYLSEPNRYRLVVPDYFQDGLWRSHGCRGATYLFLRYCVDRYGTNLLTELSKSNLEGVENIEVATQTHFRDLFRQWSIAMATSGVVGMPVKGGIQSISLYGRLGERMLTGVRTSTLESNDITMSLAPTSWGSVLVPVKQGEACRVDLVSADREDLQVTLVRLPVAKNQVHLTVRPEKLGERAVSLELAAVEPVQWKVVTWERLRLRQQNARDNEKMARIVAAPELLHNGDRMNSHDISDSIPLHEFGEDPVVFKVMGEDRNGRIVTAWGVHEVRSDLVTASADKD